MMFPDEEFFLSYSLDRVLVIDASDLKAVKVAVCHNKDPDKVDTWQPRTVSELHVWDFNQAYDYLDLHQKQVERRYFSDMSYVSTQRTALDRWLKTI